MGEEKDAGTVLYLTDQTAFMHDPADFVVAVIGRLLYQCIRLDAFTKHVRARRVKQRTCKGRDASRGIGYLLWDVRWTCNREKEGAYMLCIFCFFQYSSAYIALCHSARYYPSGTVREQHIVKK